MTTQKTEVPNTFFTAIFTEKICLQQSQIPETHWKFGTRKTYPQWKKTRLHLLFCGCNHWWKMQCSFITKGPFIRILSQQQQDTQVFYRNGLFLFSTLYWRTLTWIISFLPYPWSQGTGKLFWRMLSQWERELSRSSSSSFRNQYELTVSVIMESLWELRGVFLLLSPFISQYCYPLIIIHNVNNYSEASEHYLLQNKRSVPKWVVQYIFTENFGSSLRIGASTSHTSVDLNY